MKTRRSRATLLMSPIGSSLGAGCILVGVIALASACSTEAASSSGGPSSSGPTATARPSCYLHDDGDCECIATNEDATRSSSEWTKVAACNSGTSKGSLSCTADVKVDGTATRCSCSVLRCGSAGGHCSCGPGASGDAVTSCTDFEWYCAANDGTTCRGGNGVYGSACANEEHNVPSCSITTVKRGADNLASCDGLRFAAPPPPTSGSGGDDDKCTGCSSDSDCHDKCLRCERSTCSCVRRLSC